MTHTDGGPDRAAVIDQLKIALRNDLDGVERMASLASAEATASEAKSEGKYDTRATEASYLARGQADRVVSLRRLIAWVDSVPLTAGPRVGLGSLVQIDEDGRRQWMFLLPDGGGVRVVVDGVTVRIVTPNAPVGDAVFGAEAGDEVEVADSERVLEVLCTR